MANFDHVDFVQEPQPQPEPEPQRMLAIAEGVPPDKNLGYVCVIIEDDKTHLPCGTVDNERLLENLWRQTGIDVPGERGQLRCACGHMHNIVLQSDWIKIG